MKKVLRRKSCRWDTHQRFVSYTVEPKWHVQAHVGVLANTSWLVPHALVSASVKTSYGVQANTHISAESSWLYCTKLRVKGKTRYFRRKKVIAKANIKFKSLILSQPLIVDVSFNIYTKTRVRRSTSYKDRVLKYARKRLMGWKEFENPKVRGTSWLSKLLASSTVIVDWKSHLLTGVEASTNWNVEHIGISGVISWNTAAIAKAKAVVVSDTRLTVSKKCVTLWNDYRRVWLHHLIRYKVFKSLAVLAVPKGVQRKGVVRGAYLPTTTVSRLSDKQRFKLGIK